jgi:hypothetical protein
MNPLQSYKSLVSAMRFGVLGTSLPLVLLGLLLPQTAKAQQSPDSPLVVHEWGTFTSIAGDDGNALVWLPIATKSDLPTFVEHYPSADVKGGLRGTVRMETPVIYFYSPRQITVAAKVSLAEGLITEWFPHASRVQPTNASPVMLDPQNTGSIEWDAVTVSPATKANFPHESTPSHYYAARKTSASSVAVETPGGNQLEKFLFYRGVSLFVPPLSAKVVVSSQLQLKNLAEGRTTIILFERRGSKLGYRVSTLDSGAVIDTPSTSGTLDSLYSDFEDMLVAQGLYRDEAHAMLETWRGSWFGEGSRLFYIAPRRFVDTVLPLSIHPSPTTLVRVFVGRIELVTPATENAVEAALLSGDYETLRKYGRFVDSIVETMITRHADPTKAERLRQAVTAFYTRRLVSTGESSTLSGETEQR